MSTKFVSPVGLLVAQGPDMAGIKKACELDAWKQPDAGLEFSLQKACYTDDTGTITMVDSTKQPVTGKLTFVIMSAIPLSPLRSVYLLKGRLKGAATLNGQPIPLTPVANGQNLATLKMCDATAVDNNGMTADTYAEIAYDAAAKIGNIVRYDNGVSAVQLLNIEALTGINTSAALPLPPSNHAQVEDVPLAHLNSGSQP